MKKKTKGRKKLLNTSQFNLAGDQQEEELVDLRSKTLRQMETLEYLNGSKMPAHFMFRDNQKSKIQNFLKLCLDRKQQRYRFLMVTGSPGAGKTLCINSILKDLDKQNCDLIRINANMVKNIQDVQELICRQLLGDTKTRTAPQIIRELTSNKYKRSCLVYIQEIELIFKPQPNSITQDFLTLFTKNNINLILLGISNTIDTIHKYGVKYSINVGKIENIVFSPYTAEQIMLIFKDKLEYIQKKMNIHINYSDKLLKFSATKLEGLRKGDFRICVQFLKELVKEMFQLATVQKKEEGSEQQYVASISLINKIFQKMYISKNELISTLPYQLQIILLALHNITKKTQALMISYKELQRQLNWIHNSLLISFTPQQMDDRLRQLQNYSIVELKKKKGCENSVVLLVGNQDIKASLSGNQLLVKFLQSQEK